MERPVLASAQGLLFPTLRRHSAVSVVWRPAAAAGLSRSPPPIPMSRSWQAFPPPVAAPRDGTVEPPPSINRLLNRDLSWLDFNDRVLAEAADPSVPPLERLRFATIVSSNLDEFFMVRVAEIARLARRSSKRRFADGLTAVQLLAQIREHVLRQKARQAAALEEIFHALGEAGLRIHADFAAAPPGLDEEIRQRLPDMQYALRRSSEPPPSLPSERIHVYVRFPGEYAILTIQEREKRLIRLPPAGRVRRFALAERWLCDRVRSFFPGREVVEAFPFKIIREADLRYRPDEEDTIEEQIAEALERRSRAKVVRLEVDAPSYSEGALFLAASMGLDSAALYRFDLPLDLRALASLCRERSSARLRYPPIRPQTPPPLRGARSVYRVIRYHDVLLHHPYDSFGPVVSFLTQAARDPAVTRIYHTMYRTTRESPIMAALKDAARRGKKVTAYIEPRARFDESNNLRWARELRRAGVKVVRPIGGFKVHSKATLVLRAEPEGERGYLHLGTGNYHPGTARQYTDLGLLTSEPALAREVAAYFSALERRRRPEGFKELLVSPENLHGRVLKLIRDETRLARAGVPARIVGKMNSLVDPDIIDALYDASRAGVRVDLLVRGICCLRPGLKGLSENVSVVSVIDRFLEHSRVYYFRNGGDEKIFLSSADWMPRNFYARYEIGFPVKNPDIKRFIRDVILEVGLADAVKAWHMRPDGAYERAGPARPGGLRSQSHFNALAMGRYAGTALEKRIPPGAGR